MMEGEATKVFQVALQPIWTTATAGRPAYTEKGLGRVCIQRSVRCFLGSDMRLHGYVVNHRKVGLLGRSGLLQSTHSTRGWLAGAVG